MPIITFWGNNKEHAGKTLSAVAIATYMAIEHNKKILLMSTSYNDPSLKNCFFKENEIVKKNPGLFRANDTSNVATQPGIAGLDRMVRSKKIEPSIITDYTKIVFKDRLEVLPGFEGDKDMYDKISESFVQILQLADQYYDLVLVDLSPHMSRQIQDEIIEISHLVISTISQRLHAINNYMEIRERNPIFKAPNVLILIGRYDKFSKYTSKNISRYMKERNQVLTLPYNTKFFEAAEEAGIPNMFLNFKKIDDERNSFFIKEVERVSENIIYRLQVLQQRI